MSKEGLRPRFAPSPTPDTAHFWAGTKQGKLLLQLDFGGLAAKFHAAP